MKKRRILARRNVEEVQVVHTRHTDTIGHTRMMNGRYVVVHIRDLEPL